MEIIQKFKGLKFVEQLGQVMQESRLHYSNNCTIEDNKLFNNSCGICIWYSTRNIISNNTANNNGVYGGVLFASSNFNTLQKIRSLTIKEEFIFATSNDNTLSSNTVQNNGNLGLFVCGKSNGNLIYNNYFNETSNNH